MSQMSLPSSSWPTKRSSFSFCARPEGLSTYLSGFFLMNSMASSNEVKLLRGMIGIPADSSSACPNSRSISSLSV
ncbi:Uncharacterised protein [uncultured archaeon]|nr:Uncharacterised protein [uncultured archaeon]